MERRGAGGDVTDLDTEVSLYEMQRVGLLTLAAVEGGHFPSLRHYAAGCAISHGLSGVLGKVHAEYRDLKLTDPTKPFSIRLTRDESEIVAGAMALLVALMPSEWVRANVTASQVTMNMMERFVDAEIMANTRAAMGL
jgi:hypothetical protein